ncbi:MAG: DsbA family protein [Mariprofundaceae bacterium]|nr:DsbA family protein [Mariprofundaceae bacterium]
MIQQTGLPDAWATPDNPEQHRAELRENTEIAYKAGGFGAPAFILRGTGKPQLFWGVDRMDFLARAVDALTE